jgi:hypothetical protein
MAWTKRASSPQAGAGGNVGRAHLPRTQYWPRCGYKRGDGRKHTRRRRPFRYAENRSHRERQAAPQSRYFSQGSCSYTTFAKAHGDPGRQCGHAGAATRPQSKKRGTETLRPPASKGNLEAMRNRKISRSQPTTAVPVLLWLFCASTRDSQSQFDEFSRLSLSWE